MEPGKRQLPAWLIGLIIAAVLFVLVVFVFDAFGIEDEPALDAISQAATALFAR
jgi:hypothetical protein